MVQTCSKAEWFGIGMVCTQWLPFCTNHPKSEQLCSDFEWYSCGMVHHIAMALTMMDHSKTEPFQIRTIFCSVFEWCLVFQVRFSSSACIRMYTVDSYQISFDSRNSAIVIDQKFLTLSVETSGISTPFNGHFFMTVVHL